MSQTDPERAVSGPMPASPVEEAISEQPSAPTADSGDGILANLGALGVSQILTWSLTLVWTVFVPRLLGPDGTGLLVLVWSVNGLLMAICGLGSRTMLVREIAADRAKAPRLIATALLVRAASCVPCVLLVFLYRTLGRFGSPEAYVLYLAAAMTVLTLLGEPMLAAFQAIERMRYLAYADVVNKGLTALVGVALVLFGFRAVALVWLMVVCAAVVAVLGWFWLSRHITLDWRHSLRRAPMFLRGSLSYWAYTLFYTLYLWIDSVLIGLLAPTAVLGYYGVPTKLFGALLFVPSILATAWLPRLSVAYSESPQRLRAAARPPLELALVLSLPVCVGSAAVADPLLRTLYGPAFGPAVPVLMILAVTTIPMYLNIIVATILTAAGRQKAWTTVLAGAGGFNIVANLILIRQFQEQAQNGAIGAAIALLATEVLVAAAGFALGHRYLSWQVLPRVARCLVATAVMAAAVLLAHRFGVIAQIGTGAVTFTTVAALLGVASQGEKQAAVAFASRALKRFMDRDRSRQPTAA